MTRTKFGLDSSIPDNKIIIKYAWHELRRLHKKNGNFITLMSYNKTLFTSITATTLMI